MEHVLCYQDEHVVRNEETAAWRNRILPLSARHQKLGSARKKTMVNELLEGTDRLTS